MRHEELPAYCDYFIDDYSGEIAKNYSHSMERSVELAKKIYIVASRIAPEGNRHSLLCIEAQLNGQACLVSCNAGTPLIQKINLPSSTTSPSNLYRCWLWGKASSRPIRATA
ncbi:hypothetical protein OH492_11065 [Vibrio chagasii]|nr:hypothetical protein [Vibrio chagasii]